MSLITFSKKLLVLHIAILVFALQNVEYRIRHVAKKIVKYSVLEFAIKYLSLFEKSKAQMSGMQIQ